MAKKIIIGGLAIFGAFNLALFVEGMIYGVGFIVIEGSRSVS